MTSPSMLGRALALALLFLLAACTRDVDERRSVQKIRQSITTPRELSLQLPRGAPLHQVALAAKARSASAPRPSSDSKLASR